MVVQAVAVGSVIQLFSGVTSVEVAVNTAGRVVEAAYAVVHAVAVGSFIQLFRAVTSVVREVHVKLSHFAATTLGNVDDAA